MNINDIKAALAARVQDAHITPVTPIKAATTNEAEPKPQPTTTTKTTTQKPRATRKASTKKDNTPTQADAPATATEQAAATVTEPPAAKPATPKTPAKRTSRKAVTKKVAQTTADLADIDTIIATQLKLGTDYAYIPGCGRKPALLKAGAEHLAAIFGFRSTSEIVHRIEDVKDGFILYEIATTLYDQQGNIVATGLGSCNSRERRYTRDFADSLNTIIKMAKKRSYVDAVLTACHASGVFTQDIKDIGRELHEVNAKEA